MLQMIGRMLAHQIDDGYLSPARIVQIRETIPETGAEMQEGARGFFSHARVAIGGSGGNTFEETKRATYLLDSVKRSDQMNFRSARVCKAGVDASGEQRAN